MSRPARSAEARATLTKVARRTDALSPAQRKVVAQIARLQARGEPLNLTAVKRRHPALLEATYAIVPFWGWKRAIEAAGLEYARLKVSLASAVECRLCGRELGALPIHLASHGTSVEPYVTEYPGAEIVCEELRARYFMRSPDGGRARRPPVPHWEPLWSAFGGGRGVIHRAAGS